MLCFDVNSRKMSKENCCPKAALDSYCFLSMRFFLSLTLVFFLLCTFALADEDDPVANYVRSTFGYSPDFAEQSVKQNTLNFILESDDQAVITWTNVSSSRVYGIQNDLETLSSLYCDIIYMSDWDACTLYIDKKPFACYNSTAEAKKVFINVDDYARFVREYFGIASAPYSANDDEPSESNFTYVLNTNSHKFHYPDCSSVKKIKDKNRKDFTGSREEIIAMGYAPCGNCKP